MVKTCFGVIFTTSHGVYGPFPCSRSRERVPTQQNALFINLSSPTYQIQSNYLDLPNLPNQTHPNIPFQHPFTAQAIVRSSYLAHGQKKIQHTGNFLAPIKVPATLIAIPNSSQHPRHTSGHGTSHSQDQLLGTWIEKDTTYLDIFILN